MTQQAEIIDHGGQIEYMDKDMFKTQLEITPQQIMSVIKLFFFF